MPQPIGGAAPLLAFLIIEIRRAVGFGTALQSFHLRKENQIAFLKAAPKPPKNETLQLRVEEEIKSKLAKYAEFIDSSESYVVSEALKLVFRKDDEFRIWLDEHNGDGDRAKSHSASLFETVGKT